MNESNIRKCKLCDREVPRILKGKYPDGKNKKWVDGNGREWNGKVCGDCHASNAKLNMKKHRALQ